MANKAQGSTDINLQYSRLSLQLDRDELANNDQKEHLVAENPSPLTLPLRYGPQTHKGWLFDVS